MTFASPVLAACLAVFTLAPALADAAPIDTRPIPYRTKVYGEQDDIFCRLSDPIENLACLAHDAAMGLDDSQVSSDHAWAAMAIELAGLIQTTASSERASLYQRAAQKTLPTTGKAELCLRDGYGICGNHQELFTRAMVFLGIPTRIVSLYYEDRAGARHSHAASEFLMSGTWRFVDTTWDAYWLRNPNDRSSLLGFEEIRRTKARPTHANRANLWLVANTTKPLDAFDYVDAPTYFLIQYGDSGVVHLDLGAAPERFRDIPNYVGANQPGADMAFQVSLPTRRAGTYNLKVTALACAGTPTLVSDRGLSVVLQQGDNLLPLGQVQTLSVSHAEGQVCYAVLDRIEYVGPPQPR